MRTFVGVIVASLLVVTLLPTAARADICADAQSMVRGKVFLAKKPLYDTKIGKEGIFKLERDKEEIPEGAKFRVLKVDCGSKKIKLVLRQESPVKMDKVDIYFFMTKGEQVMKNAADNLKVMMTYVMEVAPDAD